MVGGYQGYPLTWDWMPPQTQTWDGYPLDLGWDTPYPDLRWGIPPTWDGVHPLLPRPGTGYAPITQSSIANTCFAAGGVPLASTQEDFLVCYVSVSDQFHKSLWALSFRSHNFLLAVTLKAILLIQSEHTLWEALIGSGKTRHVWNGKLFYRNVSLLFLFIRLLKCLVVKKQTYGLVNDR